MSAPKGNQFWKMRSRHGRKPVFDDPAKLEESCCCYFEWVVANPLYEDKIGFYKGNAIHASVAKMRAMTIAGLCIFINVSVKCWIGWRKEREDLGNVIAWAETVIKVQKFEGAAAGFFNANIIARDLWLGDKTEIQALDKKGEKADLTAPFFELADAQIAAMKEQHGKRS